MGPSKRAKKVGELMEEEVSVVMERGPMSHQDCQLVKMALKEAQEGERQRMAAFCDPILTELSRISASISKLHERMDILEKQ